MKNLKKEILRKIKKEEIHPLPSVIFLLKNIAFWTLFAASIGVGAVALSLVFFAVLSFEGELFFRPHFPPLQMLVTTAFLLWIVLFFLLFLAAIFGIRHTRSGYKLSTTKLLLGNFAASIALAMGFLVFGGAEKIEEFFAVRAPVFSHFEGQKRMWEDPAHGFLGGEVDEISKDKIILLHDFSGKRWVVKTGDLSDDFWEEADFLFPKAQIRVIGKKRRKSEFDAEMIFPWRCPFFWEETPPPPNFEKNFERKNTPPRMRR